MSKKPDFIYKNLGVAHNSVALDRTVFVRDLKSLPFDQQSILMTESECLLEDMELQLEDRRDSDDHCWIERISAKILCTRKFLLACKYYVGPGINDRRIKETRLQEEKMQDFLDACASLLDINDPQYLKAFLLLRERARVVLSPRRTRHFDGRLLNSKDKQKIETAIELCEESGMPSLKHLAANLRLRLSQLPPQEQIIPIGLKTAS